MSSTSSSSELPNFCPCCGGKYRFSSVPELRAHLVSRHTYETLLFLSQTCVRSSRPVALLPLPSSVVAQRHGFPLGLEAQTLPLPLNYLDLASSSASIQLVRKLFAPLDLGPAEDASTALALNSYGEPFPGRTLRDVGVHQGLGVGLSVRIGLEERLGLSLNYKIACRFAEVEERVNRRVGQLETELRRREAELEAERRDGEQLKREKQEVEERAAYLSRQVSVAMDMMDKLRNALERKEEELRERQQGMADIESFLRDTAEKETEAKSRLQVFIETLLERAEHAEKHLLLLASHTTGQARGHTPGGRSMDTSTDDIITDKMEVTSGYRRSYSVSDSNRLEDHLYVPHFHGGLTGHARSLGSEDWDDDLRPCPPSWTERERGGGDAGRERVRMGDRRDGRTWSNRSCRHHSTEEEEEEEEMFWSSSEMRRLVLARTDTPAAESSSPQSTPSCHHGDRQLGADSLRLRAALFCIFPYLDVHSLLRAAEVCSDWRFVARHPAVWTRFRLENARVSAEFLSTLSQWCTQTQSVVLNNLKPRCRQAVETPEDYHKNTRGIMELGLEALLRSAGGSLLHLSVSQCPHILTERTLWLASCYCRNLEMLTYRSSSDPASQEVLWALGAGCRNITSLHVSPAHLCQQPTRFGNRCLQTIGRCWPLLRSLSVGGAECETQGLVALVRSCADLQVLELECITDLGLQAATEMCKAGLKSLETLILKHTPVSGQAILHFHSECKNIRSITVEVLAADYFEEPDTQEARHLFSEILATLKVLQMRPGLCDVLEVKVEGFC